MTRNPFPTILLFTVLAATASAQDPDPATIDSIRPSGVLRASAIVDSVFVDRTKPQAFVFAGDWGAYLMVRLGAVPIPEDLKIEVQCDTGRMVLRTRVGDLPLEARLALGPLLGLVPPETLIEGDVVLWTMGPRVARFRLDAARISGVPVPERFLQEVMAGVGRQYPALTHTGRDLLIQIPEGAEIRLARGGVLLIGAPAPEPPP